MTTEERYETHTYDVVVIGAGGAGLRAAISASQAGLKTALVCKSLLGKAHTVMAEGGVAASLGNVDPADGWETHFGDTMRSGKGINDWRMVEFFAREAPERVLELERWGAVFDRTAEGKISQRPFGAHTYRRLAHIGDRTGLEIIRALQDKGVHSGIDVFMEYTCTRLLKDGEKIAGAVSYRREDGRIVVFRAKAVVLATGGWGKVFRVTSNSWESTGDGVMMAFEAGAELKDMEMVQFHPTGMVWPPGVRGILVTEAVRGEGGHLKNNDGKRFMVDYDPKKMELSSRDVVARAIYKEVLAGRGSPHGGAFLDATHLGAEKIKKKLPSMYDQFLKLADIDITKTPMEVSPTIHYTMGGIHVEPATGATTVPGLFAAGEVACGVHGANRLGGNSLSDLLVFGKRAGEGAAAYAAALPAMPALVASQIERERELLMAPFESRGKENPYALHELLQNIMQAHAGIARDGATLRAGLEKLAALEKRLGDMHVEGSVMFNPSWHMARDVRFMVRVSQCIVLAAIERTESRGGHWRTDHPDLDAAWGTKNVMCALEGDKIRVFTRDVPPMPPNLKAIYESQPLSTATAQAKSAPTTSAPAGGSAP
ncbi:MAG: FAD-binding protein [Thermoplasmatota archaeon]